MANKTRQNYFHPEIIETWVDNGDGTYSLEVALASGGGGGGPATIADGADVTQGAKADAAATTDTGTFTLVALFKRLLQKFTTQFPAALGGTTSANSFPVTLATDGQFVTNTGAVTETAPATDTASSGLNGRLQRVAQRLTSIIAFFGLTNNNAAPAATNIGVLAGLANAAPPTLSEGNQVLGSLNLRGDLRVIAAGHVPAAPTCTFTRGANTTAYTIGDEVGTAGTAPTSVTVARLNGGTGVVLGAQVVYSSYAAVIPQLVVMLFSATVTLAGDNAQLNLSDADAALCIGMIPLTASQSGQYSAGAPVAAGNTIFVGAPTGPIEYVAGASVQTIFAALITLNAFTPIANSETAILTLRVENN